MSINAGSGARRNRLNRKSRKRKNPKNGSRLKLKRKKNQNRKPGNLRAKSRNPPGKPARKNPLKLSSLKDVC